MTRAGSDILQVLSRQLLACPTEEVVLDDPGASLGSSELIDRATASYAERRRRDIQFGSDADLFRDPAWDILLGLYIDQRRGRRATVGTACMASCVSGSAAIRWIAALIQRGLLVLEPHRSDRECHLLALSPDAILSLERVLTDMH